MEYGFATSEVNGGGNHNGIKFLGFEVENETTN